MEIFEELKHTYSKFFLTRKYYELINALGVSLLLDGLKGQYFNQSPKKNDIIHLIKYFELQDSITIGINLWLAPQISEHWPKNRPGALIKNDDWLRRPGTASALTARAGIVHEWITSAAEMRIRV